MIFLVQLKNPFNPFAKKISHHSDEASLREMLKEANGEGFVDFTMPTIAQVGRRFVLREDWEKRGKFKSGDIVITAPAQGVSGLLIASLILAVVAIGVSVYMYTQMPKNPSDQAQADSVYSLNGARNQSRLGNCQEVCYGRNRMYPSVAAAAYNQYIGNNQYLFQLFCLGIGKFSIEKIMIEDTDISQFGEVQYQVVQPFGEVTLFPTRVVTAIEVNNIELLGANEANYPFAGWYGGFIVNPVGSKATRLEVDITAPSGVFYTNDKGNMVARTICYEFQYREVDENGSPIGLWLPFSGNGCRTLTTSTPQRWTISQTVLAGRYEVRGRRGNNRDLSIRAQDRIMWEAARGFLEGKNTYGNVTMLAVKAKATNNLNSSASARINLICTRVISVLSAAGVWEEKPSRSIVWAFYDLFTKNYGAFENPESLDLESLRALDAFYTARGDKFDYVFDQISTVWECANTIAKAGRAVPALVGSRLTMLRDNADELPTALYTPQNMVKNTFQYSVDFPTDTDPDGLEVEYTDETTFKPETLICLVEGDSGLFTEKMRLYGITDRKQAWREGMFLRAAKKFRKESVSFTTGLEGQLPTYSSLISVAHDTTRWGQTGEVVDVEKRSGRIFSVRLSNPVAVQAGESYQIYFRTKTGGVDGSYPVTLSSDGAVATFANGGSVPDSLIVQDFNRERTYYSIGISGQAVKLCKVVSTSPSDGESVQMDCVLNDPRVYAYDTTLPPPLTEKDSTPPPAIPKVTNFSVVQSPSDAGLVELKWTSALGASSYVIQTSWDGENWDSVASTVDTVFMLPVAYGHIWIRVAGIGLGIGEWATWEGDVGQSTDVPAIVTGLRVEAESEGLSAVFVWDAQSVAVKYNVQMANTTPFLIKHNEDVVNNQFAYSYQMAVDDGGAVSRSMQIAVSAINGIGDASDAPAILNFFIEPPPVLTGLSANLVSGTQYRFAWVPYTADNFKFYRFHTGAAGFTPSDANKRYEGTDANFLYNIGATAPSDIYWTVAAFDVWGQQYSEANYAPLQRLAEPPPPPPDEEP